MIFSKIFKIFNPFPKKKNILKIIIKIIWIKQLNANQRIL